MSYVVPSHSATQDDFKLSITRRQDYALLHSNSKELEMNPEVHQEENGEINYGISTQQILGRLNKKRGRRDHFEN